MADRLTQLQDCLDNLLDQMYSSLNYIQARHPYGEIPGQPSQAPESAVTSAPTDLGVLSNGGATHKAQDESPSTPPPETSEVFNEELKKRAQNLVITQHQIEMIIKSLPGVENSEAKQESEMRELEVKLRKAEQDRAKAEGEKEKMVDLLGQIIVGAKRVP